MDYNEFWSEVRKLQHKTGWRYGQALFNALLDIRPEIAEALRATEADPFYAADPGDGRVLAAAAFIADRW